MSVFEVHGKKIAIGHIVQYSDQFNTTHPALITQLSQGIDGNYQANLYVFQANGGGTKPELDVPYSVWGLPNTWNHLLTEPEAVPTKEEQREAEKAAEEERAKNEPAPVAEEHKAEHPVKKSDHNHGKR